MGRGGGKQAHLLNYVGLDGPPQRSQREAPQNPADSPPPFLVKEASLPGSQQLACLVWESEVAGVSLNLRSLRLSPIGCYAYGDNLPLGALPPVGRDRAGNGYLPLSHLLDLGAQGQWLIDGCRG